MKPAKAKVVSYLLKSAEKIQSAPASKAAPVLLECSTLMLLAGFPDLAYGGFLQLIQGDRKLSKASSLVHPLQVIMPALCDHLRMPCPALFAQPAMAAAELEVYLQKQRQDYAQLSSIDRWMQLPMPTSNWEPAFLHDLTHPRGDVKGPEKIQIHRFLQDLNRIISQSCINQGRWQEATRFLDIFIAVVDVWKIDCKSYIEQETLIFGIRTYLQLNQLDKADQYIQRWWRSLERPLDALYIVAYLPALMARITAGTLQGEIPISRTQAQEFLSALGTQADVAEADTFVPTVADWSEFLTIWNQTIFDHLDATEIDLYQHQYPAVMAGRNCATAAATAAEIAALEQRLGMQLPVSYRTFLIAANGFTILNEYCQLYGTDQIKWFVEENQDWADAWEQGDEVNDDTYFQYGEHQDCIWIRGRYLKTALQISSTEDGDVYLLNPEIKDSRNEWEAWEFGVKLPGAYRYRSFWDMMQAIANRDRD